MNRGSQTCPYLRRVALRQRHFYRRALRYRHEPEMLRPMVICAVRREIVVWGHPRWAMRLDVWSREGRYRRRCCRWVGLFARRVGIVIAFIHYWWSDPVRFFEVADRFDRRLREALADPAALRRFEPLVREALEVTTSTGNSPYPHAEASTAPRDASAEQERRET